MCEPAVGSRKLPGVIPLCKSTAAVLSLLRHQSTRIAERKPFRITQSPNLTRTKDTHVTFGRRNIASSAVRAASSRQQRMHADKTVASQMMATAELSSTVSVLPHGTLPCTGRLILLTCSHYLTNFLRSLRHSFQTPSRPQRSPSTNMHAHSCPCGYGYVIIHACTLLASTAAQANPVLPSPQPLCPVALQLHAAPRFSDDFTPRVCHAPVRFAHAACHAACCTATRSTMEHLIRLRIWRI